MKIFLLNITYRLQEFTLSLLGIKCNSELKIWSQVPSFDDVKLHKN